MNYIITGKTFTSPLIQKLRENKNYKILSEEELKNSKISFSENDKIYCPEETSVPFLEKGMSKQRWEQMQLIKNKHQCRILLKNIYPDFFFKSVSIETLANEKLPESKKFIIKPQKGFFGVGVREITSESKLIEIAEDIKNEILKHVKIFSEDVFTSNDFIIEEFVTGDEYSFDIFYNEQGDVVLNSFCRHPLPVHEEYFHLLYYTGKEIYDKFHEQVIRIFTEFNKTLKLKNIPIHAEFKEENGKLVPIEFNVPRFGGFGLADLPFHAFQENPYENFFENKTPDWKSIFEKNNKNYGWVLCYNGYKLDLEKFEPDYDKLQNEIGNIKQFHILDYKNNPAFALVFVEFENKNQINKVLATEFKDYFRLKK
jgi:hypothetical protein